jgi:plasmid stabilization system protein ParE
MTFVFHPLAQAELQDALDYYEQQQPGLGLEFLEEAYATIQRILQFPTAWPEASSRTRRCLTNRFPFGVIYQLRESDILIIAVMHHRRKPAYWADRL